VHGDAARAGHPRRPDRRARAHRPGRSGGSCAVLLPGGGWSMSAAAAAARPPVNKWLVTLSVTFGTLMGAIDISIVAVATPHLRGALGATVEEMTWVT